MEEIVPLGFLLARPDLTLNHLHSVISIRYCCSVIWSAKNL